MYLPGLAVVDGMALISTVAGASGTTTTQYPSSEFLFYVGDKGGESLGPYVLCPEPRCLDEDMKIHSSRDVSSPVDNDSTIKH